MTWMDLEGGRFNPSLCPLSQHSTCGGIILDFVLNAFGAYGVSTFVGVRNGMPAFEHILIIGGALAHDLALRGFKVTLVEKGELLSGTIGRRHGLLHSGVRCVLHDPAAAAECRQENRILLPAGANGGFLP